MICAECQSCIECLSRVRELCELFKEERLSLSIV